MNIFVIGNRLSGKTPFSIEVSAATGLQHIEASNWLRSHFESGEFAFMLMDAELMNRITMEELSRDPNACAKYVLAKLSVGRHAIVDGIFTLGDFLTVFNPDRDVIVELRHARSNIKPTEYEQGLEAVTRHVKQCLASGALPANRVYRYSFNEFRRAPTPESVVVQGSKITCRSLSDAIAHFTGEALKSLKP